MTSPIVPTALVEQGVEVTWDANGKPRFRAEFGRGPRILVASIPKAGTYLAAALLEEIGSIAAGVHVAEWGLTDTRHPLEAVRADPLAVTVTVPVEEVVSLIGSGQFVVGHLPHNDRIRRAFAGYSIVFLRRDVRAAFVSFMRYMSRHGYGSSREGWGSLPGGPEKAAIFARKHGEEFFSMARPMKTWMGAKGVTCLAFEDLVGDNGINAQTSAVRHLADVVDPSAIVTDDLVRSGLLAETLTRSPTRTRVELYWSDEVDHIFGELGGHALNRALGYS